jgi:hypothetical protein
MKDLSGKVTNDQLTAAEFDDFFGENKNQVEGANISLSDSDNFQILKSAANQAAYGDYYTGGGSGTAYTLTAIAPRKGITDYFAGMRVRFLAPANNIGAATVNVNSQGVENIVHDDGSALKDDQILQNNFTTLVYNGTNFVLIDDGRGSGYTTSLARDYRSGCLVSNNTTDAAHDLDIAIGDWRDSTNTVNLKLLTAFTKEMDSTWAVGTGNGGMASGATLSGNNGYYLFLVGGSGKTTDVIGDDNVTGSNILTDAAIIAEYGSGNIFIKDIHWFRHETSPSARIRPFKMNIVGDQRITLWDEPIIGFSKTSGFDTSRHDEAIDYMVNKTNAIGLFNAMYLHLSSSQPQGVCIFSADLADQTPSISGAPGGTLFAQNGDTTISSDIEKRLLYDAGGKPKLSYHQIAVGVPTQLFIISHGWID